MFKYVLNVYPLTFFCFFHSFSSLIERTFNYGADATISFSSQFVVHPWHIQLFLIDFKIEAWVARPFYSCSVHFVEEKK